MSIPSRAELQSPPPASPPASSPQPTTESILAELGYINTSAVEADPDVLADEQAAAMEAAGVAAEAPAPVTPAETPKPPEPAKPVEDPRIAELMARESAAIEKEQAVKEAHKIVGEVLPRLDAFEKAKANFDLDPLAHIVSYVRALSPEFDTDSLARALWYEKLGTAAPLEHRVTQQARTAQTEVQKLRSELDAERKRNAEDNARKEAEAAEARYVDDLRGYLASVPSELTSVQSLAKQKPDMAVRMMHQAAGMIAPGLGRRPTTEEAAKAVQQYLDEIGYAATPVPVPVPQEQTKVSAPQDPPTTIRNVHSAVQTGRIPPDENDPRVKRREAFRAMAEAVGDPRLADLPVDW